MTSDYPGTSIVAGEVRRMTGLTGDMLKMHDGAIYISITPDVAKQWLPIIQQIADSK